MRAARAYLERLDRLGMRFGTQRMRALMAALGHPERCADHVLHVVGTNGKSSTARLAAAALAGSDLRVGAYLSPHLGDWTERIEVDGRPLPADEFVAAVAAVRAAVADLPREPGDRVTQFEVLTAVAFLALARAGVGAMVVEAGLGGRYDATNVLAPDPGDPAAAGRAPVVALTNVALEHTELLGDTEAAIAAEKLAVAPDGHDRVVVGRLSPTAARAVEAEMARRGLSGPRHGHDLHAHVDAHVAAHVGGVGDDEVCVLTPWGRYDNLPLPLRGGFQRDNLAVALAGAELALGRPLRAERLRASLAEVAVPGRLELFPGVPPVLVDGAHNPAGMAAMAGELPGLLCGRRVVALVSLLADKDAEGMMEVLGAVAERVVATDSGHPRAVAPGVLAALAGARGLPADAIDDPVAALARARALAGADGAVVVCGSLYLLGALRETLLTPREHPVTAPKPAAKLARASVSPGSR